MPPLSAPNGESLVQFNNRVKLLVGAATLALSAGACNPDLEITNPNNPDVERAISTPAELASTGVTEPAAQRHLAELLDAKGDLRGALRYYEAFLANWTNPEPEQAATVRTVKARVAELRAKLSPG